MTFNQSKRSQEEINKKAEAVESALKQSGIVLTDDQITKLQKSSSLSDMGWKVSKLLMESTAKDENIYKLADFHVTKFQQAIQLAENKYGTSIREKGGDKFYQFIHELKHVLSEQNAQKLQKFFADCYQKDPKTYGFFVNNILIGAKESGNPLFIYETDNYDNTSNIMKYINELKLGVCRHYSMIAKKIYEVIAPSYFPDSELLYVCNHKTKHAYNILLYENKNREIEKQYVDITLFITGNSLLRDEKDVIRTE